MCSSFPVFQCVSRALAAVVIIATSCFGDESLIGQWEFKRANVKANQIVRSSSGLNAKVGSAKFLGRPEALVLGGDAKHRVSIDGAKLPAPAITAEAWLMIDKPIEWGGIVGAIQDNGDYEKGWLLGYRKSQFYFAVSSVKVRRLTYLLSPQQFEPGQWYHVVGTYDGVEQKLFVDGKLVANAKKQRGDIDYPPRAMFTIGAYHDDNETYAMTGRVERVSVHGRALTATSVLARFNERKREFPGIIPVKPVVKDWPTYMRDNVRSGLSDEKLTFPLHLQWVYRTTHPPRPAWPQPAQRDIWHKKDKLKPRVTYDRAFHVVSADGRVYFGSSADDRVVCLDAKSGEELWAFHTEGPVRLAPTLAGDRLLFGSDDGNVYCVRANDGGLLWKHRLGPTDRMIVGNQRVISAWPVRTGVLVEGDIAYFSAGLFPSQGAWQAAVSLKTGKLLGSGPLNVSPQGYPERRGGRLYMPTGRDPAGAFVSQLQRRGKAYGKEVNTIADEFPYAFIGAKDVRIAGGDGKVGAFSAKDGRGLWVSTLVGKAYSLAVADGKLLVSTDRGRVYSFGSRRVSDAPSHTQTLEDKDTVVNPVDRSLIDLLSGAKGYCLVVGARNIKLIESLAAHTGLSIVVVDPSLQQVKQVRNVLENRSFSNRIAVHHKPLNELPYTDYLFNAIVATPISAAYVSSMVRLLRPDGGRLFTWKDGQWTVTSRGPLENTGEWTHMYADAANTVCSGDTRVKGKMQLQWFGRPGPRQMVDRHHRTIAPLWTRGRLFIPGDDRVIAADAYNGTQLWNVEIPNSRRVAAFRDSSYMVATDDALYVAAGNECISLNAQTGARDGAMKVPVDGDWGYVASVGDTLFGSATKPGAARREVSYKVAGTVAYRDLVPIVVSDSLFAFNRRDRSLRWNHMPTGAVVNPTIAIGDGKMFFVESADPTSLKIKSGRAKLTDLFKGGANVVALDAKTGKLAWRQPIDFSAIQHNVFLSYAQGKVIVAGSRNDGKDKKKSRVWYDVYAFDVKTGKLAWRTSQNQNTGIGGDHGEQDHHPVIVGDRLYCEPYAYELDSGKPIAWKWNKKHRRGCGAISASASTFFFRNKNPTMFDLKLNAYAPVTSSTRPGCWINMIPAGGLLLIPEASSGCSCNFSVQTSLAFIPVP